MKLLFKQRFFSWFDSYDIFTEFNQTAYTVKGQFSWGHCLKIFDAFGEELGTVKQRIFTLLPTFELYHKDRYIGCIHKEFSFFRPRYNIDYNSWHVEGNFMEWDYTILDQHNRLVATVSKELFNWTDTYAMDIEKPEDALGVLMLVLAIDAEKCSRNN